MVDAYALLRQSVVDAGLLHRTYAYYGWRTTLSFAILTSGIALAFAAPVLAVPLIAIGSVQVALVGHDAGHLAVFASRRANAVLGSVCWSLAVGISYWYWTDRHNRHHAHTNDTDRDPDLQWDFGPALAPFLAFTFRVEGWRFAERQLRGGRRIVELALLLLSTAVWLLPTFEMGPWWLATYLVSQVLAGVYLAAVVAPNHIGMPIWQAAPPLAFLERQLLSSRNVTPGHVTDFFFGGLNYQIEHHLFPTMPRANFARARALVRPFCASRGLPYAESGVIAVYRTVLAELPRLGRAEPA